MNKGYNADLIKQAEKYLVLVCFMVLFSELLTTSSGGSETSQNNVLTAAHSSYNVVLSSPPPSGGTSSVSGSGIDQHSFNISLGTHASANQTDTLRRNSIYQSGFGHKSS